MDDRRSQKSDLNLTKLSTFSTSNPSEIKQFDSINISHKEAKKTLEKEDPKNRLQRYKSLFVKDESSQAPIIKQSTLNNNQINERVSRKSSSHDSSIKSDSSNSMEDQVIQKNYSQQKSKFFQYKGAILTNSNNSSNEDSSPHSLSSSVKYVQPEDQSPDFKNNPDEGAQNDKSNVTSELYEKINETSNENQLTKCDAL